MAVKPLQLAKEYLIANPSASNETVVAALGISPRTVSTARQALVQMGLLPRSFYDRRNGPGASPEESGAPDGPPMGSPPGPSVAVEGVQTLAKIEEALKKDLGEPLTPENSRKRLSAIARKCAELGEYNLEISAIQALARLDAQLGARDRLGPGPPLSEEAKTHRIALLLEAVGPKITAKALVEAFERPQLDRLIDGLGRAMASSLFKNDPEVLEEHRKVSDEHRTEDSAGAPALDAPEGTQISIPWGPDAPELGSGEARDAELDDRGGDSLTGGAGSEKGSGE